MTDVVYSYVVTAVEREAFCDAVLAKANEVWLTIPAPTPRVFVYDGTGRPKFGRDMRGRYWQRRVEWLCARMKRRYDARRARYGELNA